MSTHKHIDFICVAVLFCTLLVTVLFMNGEALGIKVIAADDDPDSGYTATDHFTGNDQNGDWKDPNATVITLKGDSISVSGGGAYAYDGDVIITNAGHFILSGSLSDGSIIVDAYASSKVWIKLDGVDIHCQDGPCLRIEKAKKVFLTLAGGSENSFTDGGSYSEEMITQGIRAAICADDDLTINGSGSLTVKGKYRHGIDCNDDLVITGGTLTVNAVKDGLHINNNLRIMAAQITIEAEDDGILIQGKTGDDGSLTEGSGYFYMESGSLSVEAEDEAIKAYGAVTVAGGTLELRTDIGQGHHGIKSDTSITVDGGSISVLQSYEGFAAPAITVNDGEVAVYPYDDGFNASAGGGDSFSMPGGQGGTGTFDASASANSQDSTDMTPPEGGAAGSETSQSCGITINGGSVTIINKSGSDADGLDSNGSIYINGGTVLVSLVNNGNNCALDYGSESGGVCEITGGTVIAAGNYSMAEGFSEGSSQCSLLYIVSEGVPAGTTVKLVSASDETVLLEQKVPASFSAIVLSCPEIRQGESYRIWCGDSCEEITIDSVSSSFGDAVSGGFNGPQGQGGGRQPGRP